MDINIEEIKKTAKLAKLDITEQEAELYTKQLSAVLDWVNQLKDVKTSPAQNPAAPDLCARQREDKPVLSPCSAEIRAAFNGKEDNFLKVKKVL